MASQATSTWFARKRVDFWVQTVFYCNNTQYIQNIHSRHVIRTWHVRMVTELTTKRSAVLRNSKACLALFVCLSVSRDFVTRYLSKVDTIVPAFLGASLKLKIQFKRMCQAIDQRVPSVESDSQSNKFLFAHKHFCAKKSKTMFYAPVFNASTSSPAFA